MIFNISNKNHSLVNQAYQNIYLHSGNELLPIGFYDFTKLSTSDFLFTLGSVRSRGRLYYSDFIRYMTYDSNLIISFSISNTRMVMVNNFVYDLDKSMPLLSVMAKREDVITRDKLSSDECVLYISDHIGTFSSTFKKTVMEIYSNFLGDVVMTKFPNQMILGHPLFKPKSKKEVVGLLEKLIK